MHELSLPSLIKLSRLLIWVINTLNMVGINQNLNNNKIPIFDRKNFFFVYQIILCLYYANLQNISSFISADLHSLIGVSLILGFVFMLLVDQCSSQRTGGKERGFTATLGLVVHAAADGVALGAAATTSQTEVEVVVFIAIMLHKVGKFV